MYFLEFLETCTIGWVWICEGGVGMERERRKTPFLNFFYARCRPPDPRLSPYTPEVETPAPSAPGQTAQHRQQHRACQTRHTGTHARTLDTLHRSALDIRQTIVSAAGLDCLRSVSGKVYNFGRLFLSIFIWIYFDESIDNPHIYGYNIISPDKYGLQPH